MNPAFTYCEEHQIRASKCREAYVLHLAGEPPPEVTPPETQQIQTNPVKRVSAEVSNARRALCRACPMYQAEGDKCRICGCGSVISHRSNSPFATCPEKRWPTLPPPEFT